MGNWNDLSMREKRDVMRLHIQGGIMDLNGIRESYNTFTSGGDIRNGTAGKSNQMQLSPLRPKPKVVDYSFIPGGYAPRKNNAANITPQNKELVKDNISKDYKNWMEARRPQMSENLNSLNIGYKEYQPQITKTYQDGTRGIIVGGGNILKDTSVNDEIKRQVNNIKSTNTSFDSKMLSDINAGGVYNWFANEVVFGSNGADKNTATHEYGHASNAAPQQFKINQILKSYNGNHINEGESLGNSGYDFSTGSYGDRYLDDPNEIYSRMMEFRLGNNIDPKKVFSTKDINNLIDQSKMYDFDENKINDYIDRWESAKRRDGVTADAIKYYDEEILKLKKSRELRRAGLRPIVEKNFLKRYKPDVIRRLLNEVAQNNQQLPDNFLNNNIT